MDFVASWYRTEVEAVKVPQPRRSSLTILCEIAPFLAWHEREGRRTSERELGALEDALKTAQSSGRSRRGEVA